MTTAREIMPGGAQCVGGNETLVDAARKMRDLDVGALPICGEDRRNKGMVSNRDTMVRCLAVGGDPASTLAQELATGKPVTIGADDSVEEAARVMAEHRVRRLPVIDGHELVGMVSQADVARKLPKEKVGETRRSDLGLTVRRWSGCPPPGRRRVRAPATRGSDGSSTDRRVQPQVRLGLPGLAAGRADCRGTAEGDGVAVRGLVRAGRLQHLRLLAVRRR